MISQSRKDELTERIAGQMDLSAVYLSDGESRIALFVHRNGIPEGYLSRERDGAIRFQNPKGMDEDITDPPEAVHDSFTDRHFNNAVQIIEEEGIAGEDEDPHQLALDIISQATLMSLGITEHQLWKEMEEATEIAQERILDDDIMQRTKRFTSEMVTEMGQIIPHPGGPSPGTSCNQNKYNAFLTHADILREARQASPALAGIWWVQMTRMDQTLLPDSPEDIARAVRGQTNLEPGEWKLLAETAPPSIMLIANNMASPRQRLDEIETICRSIAASQLKPGEVCLQSIQMVWEKRFSHVGFGLIPEQHPGARDLWGHIIRQGLLDHRETCSGGEDMGHTRETVLQANRIEDVGHALREALRDGEEWPMAAWETYHRRAQERNQRMAERHSPGTLRTQTQET